MSLPPTLRAPGVQRDPSGPVVAAFDFDGTLTRGDSLIPWLRLGLGPLGLAGALLRSTPWLLAWQLRLISNEAAKVRLLRVSLRGRSREELAGWTRRFVADRLPGLLRPELLARLRWHQAQGHRCVMVSASADVYLEAVAAALGIEHLLCSRLDWTADGRCTGRLIGRNCHGAEKVRRLQAWWAAEPPACVWAYGDSRGGDGPMLAQAEHAVFRGVAQTART